MNLLYPKYFKFRFYSSLGIFKQTMIHKKLGMDKDYLATKAIPFLFPLAVEPGLNLSQVICVTRLNNGDVIDQVIEIKNK